MRSPGFEVRVMFSGLYLDKPCPLSQLNNTNVVRAPLSCLTIPLKNVLKSCPFKQPRPDKKTSGLPAWTLVPSKDTAPPPLTALF